MGEPIRVVDIATDLIRLSGLTVGSDIEIRFTGMRPGEKLYEEMFFSAENVLTTDHPKVLRARNGILPEGVMRRIEALVAAAEAEHPDEELRELLRSLVPDFHPHPPPQLPHEPRASQDFKSERGSADEDSKSAVVRRA